jgi:hypothetical protein
VQLLQGRPGSLTFVAETKSDERGDYRLDDIMPGSYILAAGAALARVPLTETLNSADGEYAFTYYPGSSTPDFTRALVIDGTGRELQADFLLSPERRHHIRGRILVERNGDHPSAVTATLRSTAPTGLLRGNFPSDNALFRYEPRNGTFEVSDLLPGQYTLSISARIDDGAQIDGSTTVTIRDFDVDGEVIALIQYKTQR